ncbi:MAG: uroporphyrinogen decarboxylase family protein [Candidatus Latescibacterota bacterium]|jgi:uroporphyrinogen decarboxylase
MNSRERVLTALRHQEPDRIPFDLSATPVTGIHHVAYRGLRQALGLPVGEPRIWHLMQQLACVEDDVHAALATDARGLRPGASATWSLRFRDDGPYRYYTDEWGITRRMRREDGLYFDLCGSPLSEVRTVAEIERYPFPAPADPARFTGLRAAAEQARAEGKAFVLGGICAGMLEMGQWLRGYEGFFCDLAADRALAEALCERILELKLAYWERALELLGDLVDVVQEGDDYGGQRGLQVSPEVWRAVFKPRLGRLLAAIKRRAPGASIFFHSCGSIAEILPDLVEVGVEALNPVQVAATGMDSRELKARYGSALTFWGGGIDTQRVLPGGTPAQVRDEVRRRIDDLAPGGGFVFAAVHNVQADVPPANLLAMRAALEEFGRYA